MFFYWDGARGLLFANSSNGDLVSERAVEAITDSQTTKIKGESVFRVFAEIKRLTPSTIGLGHAVSRKVRHTSLFGADVAEAFDPVRSRNKSKSFLFGCGYESGARVGVGASAKGRIWSQISSGTLAQWVDWCDHIGTKLLDDKIRVPEILGSFIVPKPVEERPLLVPLALEWPQYVLQRSEDSIQLVIDGKATSFYEVSLDLVSTTRSGPIDFTVTTPEVSLPYRIAFGRSGTSYQALGVDASIQVGRKSSSLSTFFGSEKPRILFEGDAYVEDDLLYQISRSGRESFNRERIQSWNWTGIDITKESQRDEKRAESIQRRVIECMISQGFDVVFDDDESGEAADVIAIRDYPEKIEIHLIHCKFSGAAAPGTRVDDLYVVCGQAQRSIHWREDVESLLHHMTLREGRRRATSRPSRFEHGDLRVLSELRQRLPYVYTEMHIGIVQPGLSRLMATAGQLELLGSTDLLLKETYEIALEVVGSD